MGGAKRRPPKRSKMRLAPPAEGGRRKKWSFVSILEGGLTLGFKNSIGSPLLDFGRNPARGGGIKEGPQFWVKLKKRFLKNLV